MALRVGELYAVLGLEDQSFRAGIRGPFADTMRTLSARTGMSLARLLKDTLLVYQQQITAGYTPGSLIASWSGDTERASAGDGS